MGVRVPAGARAQAREASRRLTRRARMLVRRVRLRWAKDSRHRARRAKDSGYRTRWRRAMPLGWAGLVRCRHIVGVRLPTPSGRRAPSSPPPQLGC